MATIVPIAYFTGGTQPAGTTLQGNLIIGDTAQDYGSFPNGYRFWATTDLTDSWCIALEVPSGDQPNPLGIPCFVGFFSGASDDDTSFVNTANYVTNNSQSFVDANTAATWLNANGYWTNFVSGHTPQVLMTLDSTLGVSGSVWTDQSGNNRNGNLNGGYGTTNFFG